MKRMLFNATHAEELRVATVEGQRLIDIDIESAGRESRKSNIYKGVVTRVEPGLEACFVNYGEERHGFLPFKEISRAYFKPGVDAGRARIQDVIAEGSTFLVQVDKEERGNKGAALTTFVSLAGRYLVLMPNNPRGGGVSRRVEGDERAELRETMDRLEVPQGMSIIARTAGIGRSYEELQWDMNYLMQLWTAIDGARGGEGAYLIYQESSLVIRAIRDYFTADIGEILIDTDDIYEQARQFMGHVMPANIAKVKRYRDDVPLFSRFQIEHQIETAHSRVVPLPSGGSIVIDHAEALVAIDVNSARATKGADIEETAFRTNSEAAEEVARQMRLRDLGGLIVIDFIDMESSKNQREVESRIREALHYDRARVQYGKISKFGLLEISRQRLRPALNEGSHLPCPRCAGTGVIRDIESTALHVLRQVQDECMKENSAAVYCQVPVDVATYLLNEKRAEITKLEARSKVEIVLIPNKNLETPHYKLERLKHDDERIGNYRATYTLAEGPDEDDNYLARRLEPQGSRQTAVVKGVTPGQPAPMPVEQPVAAPVVAASISAPAAAPVVANAAASAASEGFFGRILSMFKAKPAPVVTAPINVAAAAPIATATSAATKNQRAERGDRNRNGRKERGERGNRNERGDRNGRDQTEAAVMPVEGQAASAPQAREDRGDRPSRNDRNKRPDNKERQERRPRQAQGELPLGDNAPVVLGAVGDAANPVADASNSAGDDQQRRGRNRRQRGRGRGERGDRIEGSNRMESESDSDNSAAFATPQTNDRADAPPANQQPLAVAVSASAAVGAAVAASYVASSPPASPAPSASLYAPDPSYSGSSVPEAVAAPAPKPRPPSGPELVAAAPSQPAPVAIDIAPSVWAPAPINAPVADLGNVVQSAGLVWVQTESAAVQELTPTAPVARPNRRRKPKAPLPNEPLSQVETGGSDS
jgi:ribonuclease E